MAAVFMGCGAGISAQMGCLIFRVLLLRPKGRLYRFFTGSGGWAVAYTAGLLVAVACLYIAHQMHLPVEVKRVAFLDN